MLHAISMLISLQPQFQNLEEAGFSWWQVIKKDQTISLPQRKNNLKINTHIILKTVHRGSPQLVPCCSANPFFKLLLLYKEVFF